MCIKTCKDIKFGEHCDGGHEGGENIVIRTSKSDNEHFQLQLQLQARLNKQKHKGYKLPNFKILMCCCYFIIIVLMI
uniref:HDC02355 n=1 Tax=Drosophila melanogaster TaxID=7227 RepID=Q6IHK5_DROME|nr:uncharacterized protein Dmel_CG43850, isoform A [Drosophila melanogaster]NP_001285900.1 uncharacterized protein Dmel_CG43850, isoform B [Drosophila melanogaster]AGB92979.1 uncharacterized protein Dmel_CG43850, isoform A [Drosophila melanogaster]AHN54414.1 uncharacterized protein Dmel_CG43850, isoform B [Drosophila melanogaster]DAA03610.1 TPA_inf: HDC02355 [Drosophila melanogaster]|eukprot:NP_001260444.1 uncharacterized protein Dmel_CG43850, isoform A [Drosophila melanogaster]